MTQAEANALLMRVGVLERQVRELVATIHSGLVVVPPPRREYRPPSLAPPAWRGHAY